MGGGAREKARTWAQRSVRATDSARLCCPNRNADGALALLSRCSACISGGRRAGGRVKQRTGYRGCGGLEEKIEEGGMNFGG